MALSVCSYRGDSHTYHCSLTDDVQPYVALDSVFRDLGPVILRYLTIPVPWFLPDKLRVVTKSITVSMVMCQ